MFSPPFPALLFLLFHFFWICVYFIFWILKSCQLISPPPTPRPPHNQGSDILILPWSWSIPDAPPLLSLAWQPHAVPMSPFSLHWIPITRAIFMWFAVVGCTWCWFYPWFTFSTANVFLSLCNVFVFCQILANTWFPKMSAVPKAITTRTTPHNITNETLFMSPSRSLHSFLLCLHLIQMLLFLFRHSMLLCIL